MSTSRARTPLARAAFRQTAPLLALLLASCGGSPAPQPAPPPPAASARPSASVQASPVPIGPPTPGPGPTDAFHLLRDRLVPEWLADEPEWARDLGFHEYDGKVGQYAKAALASRIARLRAEKDELSTFDPKALSADDALDLAILVKMADETLFHLADLDDPRTKPPFYEGIFTVNTYLDRDYAPIAERAKRLVAHEEAALAEVPHVFENLALPMSKPVAETSVKIFAGFAEYLRGDVVKLLKGVGDKDFQQKFAKTNEALAKKADEIAGWLKKKVVPHGDQSHVLGEARFRKLLEVQEGLTLPLAEFKKMGEDNLAVNKAAYQELRARAKITRPTAGTLMADATRLMEGSRKFIADKRIVTIPSEDTAVVKESPPYKRWNAAFLDSSGPFDTARSAFFYITLPDKKWPKKEQEEYIPTAGILLATTVHEVYPGHFLQGRWVERAPSKVQKMAGSYSFVEGWAHYGEQLMIEEGFGAEDPQNKVGQLSDALLRNCRFVVALGIHAEGMSVEEGEKRFMRDCFQDKATAHEQAVRGTFDPGYFAYTLGKLEILALREEAKQKLGPAFSLQRFHDALLSHGSPPVALIHNRVLAELSAAR